MALSTCRWLRSGGGHYRCHAGLREAPKVLVVVGGSHHFAPMYVVNIAVMVRIVLTGFVTGGGLDGRHHRRDARKVSHGMTAGRSIFFPTVPCSWRMGRK